MVTESLLSEAVKAFGCGPEWPIEGGEETQ